MAISLASYMRAALLICAVASVGVLLSRVAFPLFIRRKARQRAETREARIWPHYGLNNTNRLLIRVSKKRTIVILEEETNKQLFSETNTAAIPPGSTKNAERFYC